MRSLIRCSLILLAVTIASPGYGQKLPKDVRQRIQSISSPNELYIFAYKLEESDPRNAIAAYESILERFPSSDVAVKATERIEHLKGIQTRETAKASAWRGRVVRFSEWFTYKVSTGSGLIDVLTAGGLSESFEVTFEAIVEDELENDLKVIIKSAEVSSGNSSIMGIDAARAYSREVINSSIGRIRLLSKSDVKPRPSLEGTDTVNKSSQQMTAEEECKDNSKGECSSRALEKGLALLDENLYSGARAVFEKALAHAGPTDRSMLLAGIGQAHYLEGDKDRAEKNFKEAFEVEPGNVQGRTNLAFILVMIGRFQDANKYAHDYSKEDLAKATELFESAVTNSPQAAWLHSYAAASYLAHGRKKEAKNHLEAFLMKAPNHVRAGWAREALSQLQP